MLIIQVPPNFRELLATDGAAIVLGAMRELGMGAEPPWDTQQALQLVTRFGYDATPTYFVRLVSQGAFEPPRRFGMSFAWRVDDVVRLLQYLDDRRRWLPGFHGSRKTPAEIARDEAEAAKGLAMIDFYKSMGVPELEQRYAEATTSPARELIRIALSMKKSELSAARNHRDVEPAANN